MNQNMQTRIRTSKEIGTVQAEQSMPIKPKCSRLQENHTAYGPISNSIQVKKQAKELKQ